MTDIPAGTPANASPRAFREWLPALSAAVLILGAIMSAGSVISKVNDSERRIGELERQVQAGGDRTQEVLQRLARIEGKMDAAGHEGRGAQ